MKANIILIIIILIFMVAHYHKKVLEFQNNILFEIHEQYIFGSPEVKSAMRSLVQKCFKSDNGIKNIDLKLFWEECVERRQYRN